MLLSQGKGGFVEMVTGPPKGAVEPVAYPVTAVALPSDLVSQLTPRGSDNDIAILGMRWTV